MAGKTPRIGDSIRINDPILGLGPVGTLLAWTVVQRGDGGERQTLALVDLGIRGGAHLTFPGQTVSTFIRVITVAAESVESAP